MNRLIFTSLAASFALAGCTVGPDFEAPDPNEVAPAEWGGVAGDAPVTTRPADLYLWWHSFRDPRLASLVELAQVNSPTILKAVYRVSEARFQLAAINGERLPQIDLTADYLRSRTSENLEGFAGLAGGGAGGPAGGGIAFDSETDLWQTGLVASWEIDLFGRLKRRVQAAERDFEAEREDLNDLLVTLTADVARAYIEVREFSTRLRIARENVAIQERSLGLARARFENGLTGELDVAQAVADVQQTRAAIPQLVARLRAAKNRAALLAGLKPGGVDRVLGPDALTVMEGDATTQPATRPGDVVPVPPRSFAIGIPADLIRRRPDIRAAERRLAADTARVGARMGDLYPRLSIAGSFGFAAGDLGDLFDNDSRTFGIGPSLTLPIFEGGRLTAQVFAADAVARQSAAVYEQTVLRALNEVSDALTNYAQDIRRRDELLLSARAASRAVEIADAQYRQGLVDFDRVLRAQQVLFAVQDALATADAAVSADAIEIFRALGGGWEPPPEPAVIVKDE